MTEKKKFLVIFSKFTLFFSGRGMVAKGSLLIAILALFFAPQEMRSLVFGPFSGSNLVIPEEPQTRIPPPGKKLLKTKTFSDVSGEYRMAVSETILENLRGEHKYLDSIRIYVDNKGRITGHGYVKDRISSKDKTEINISGELKNPRQKEDKKFITLFEYYLKFNGNIVSKGNLKFFADNISDDISHGIKIDLNGYSGRMLMDRY